MIFKHVCFIEAIYFLAGYYKKINIVFKEDLKSKHVKKISLERIYFPISRNLFY